MFSNLMLDKDLYANLLENKIDESLIDALFNAAEDYIDDIPVTSEINNALCMICLRSDKYAKYIVSKGGLQNIVEEIKSLMNMNDPISKSKKMFGLKFIESLVKDESNMDKFIELKGNDLVHNIIKNSLDDIKNKKSEKKLNSLAELNSKNQGENEDNKNNLLNDKNNFKFQSLVIPVLQNLNNKDKDEKFGSEIIQDIKMVNNLQLGNLEKNKNEENDFETA